MDRKQQQAELLVALGELLRPLQDVADFPGNHNTQARAKACAKFIFDADVFIGLLHKFSHSQPGHRYDMETNKVIHARNRLRNELAEHRDNDAKLRASLADCRNVMLTAILDIPSESDSEVLEARSPFQAYCKMKAFFETTATRIIWADQYMGAGLFHRYLNVLPDSVEVVLVTKDRGNHPEYQSFLDVSRLYATERGATKYRLVVESTSHDRWLRSDDQLYHLGGSAKDAGKRSPFTISKMAPTPANFQQLDGLIAGGIELFGPSTPNHA